MSVAGASTITDRLVRLFARPAPGARNHGFLAFPTPADVAEAGADRLRRLGLTRTRAATLHGAARRIATGTWISSSFVPCPPTKRRQRSRQLPGIGPWTASYVRMRALGDRDAFPSADLGVIKAMQAAGVARGSIVEASPNVAAVARLRDAAFLGISVRSPLSQQRSATRRFTHPEVPMSRRLRGPCARVCTSRRATPWQPGPRRRRRIAGPSCSRRTADSGARE